MVIEMAKGKRGGREGRRTKGCGRTLGFKAECLTTGNQEDVICGSITSDWNGKNSSILLCKKCQQ